MSERDDTSPYHTDTLSYLTINTSLGPVGCALENLSLIREVLAAVNHIQIKYSAGLRTVAMMTCVLAPSGDKETVNFVFTALLKERTRSSFVTYQTIQLIKTLNKADT